MKQLLSTTAHSLKDFRLLPGFTDDKAHVIKISLKSRLCRHGDDFMFVDLPFVSAAMRATTGVEIATALAELGGVGVIPLFQSIEEQCEKVKRVKQYKAGFQTEIITFSPSDPLANVKKIIDEKGFTTFPVTDTGIFHGKLVGVITDKDFDPRYDLELNVNERMKKDIRAGIEIEDLKEANRLMIEFGHGFLPIISQEGTLQSVVFKKDLDKHIKYPDATVDLRKRLRVGAAVSTHPEDRDRVHELIKTGTDFIVIDASDGFSVYQKETIKRIKKDFDIPVIGGNVVTSEGFHMLVEAGADAVKIGIGVGSGCTTSIVKAIGRGQATAIMEIAKTRDQYAENASYIPIMADGGINSPSDIAIALAMGADTVMMGHYFAQFTESPGRTKEINGVKVKEYWMEGSMKGYNLRRYGQSNETFFEEGINGFVPHMGSIYDLVPVSRKRLTGTLSSIGASTIDEFRELAVLEIQSQFAQADGMVHDMMQVGLNDSRFQFLD